MGQIRAKIRLIGEILVIFVPINHEFALSINSYKFQGFFCLLIHKWFVQGERGQSFSGTGSTNHTHAKAGVNDERREQG